MGGLGFWLGARVNDRAPEMAPSRGAHAASTPRPAAPTPLPEVPLARASTLAPPPSTLAPLAAPSAASSPPPASNGAPPAQPAPPAGPPSPPGASPAARERLQDRSSAARSTKAAGVSSPTAVDRAARLRDTSFLETVRLLSRAQRALDGGEPALALVLLDEIDERAPRELLREEREAARVIALCKSGDIERARTAAAQLAGYNPSSIYAARIARSCGSIGAAPSSAAEPATGAEPKPEPGAADDRASRASRASSTGSE